MAFLCRCKSKVWGECPNIFIANAFVAILPIFLTLISLTFGSDHKVQKMLGVSQSKSSWKKYQCPPWREWRYRSLAVPSCCAWWWLGWMQTCHWTPVGIHREREIAMKQPKILKASQIWFHSNKGCHLMFCRHIRIQPMKILAESYSNKDFHEPLLYSGKIERKCSCVSSWYCKPKQPANFQVLHRYFNIRTQALILKRKKYI